MTAKWLRGIVFSMGLLGPARAYASDAASDAAPIEDVSDLDDVGADAAPSDDSASGTSGPPLACDGALCDSTNGAMCTVYTPRPSPSSTITVVFLVVGALLLRRRRRPRWVGALTHRPSTNRWTTGASICMATLISWCACAAAQAESPATTSSSPSAVDVTITEDTPRRRVLIEWNPLPAFTIGKASANIVFAPVDHHALIFSPFYASASTAPIAVFNDPNNPGTPTAVLPTQTFQGGGAELGYRYYFGLAGPRGFFVGGSFLAAYFAAIAADGTTTPYWNLGLAIDGGYQILLGDRLSLSLGAGVQGVVRDKAIPNQQFPASIYANGGLLPRVLGSIGWAFL
jgi:hypothetical protein